MSDKSSEGTTVKVSRCETQVLRSLIKRGKKKGQKPAFLELRPIDVADKIEPNSQYPASWASVYLKRLLTKGLVENVGTQTRGVYKLSSIGKTTLKSLIRNRKKN